MVVVLKPQLRSSEIVPVLKLLITTAEVALSVLSSSRLGASWVAG